MRRRYYMTSYEKWLLAILGGTVALVLFSPVMFDLYGRLFSLFGNVSPTTSYTTGVIISAIILVLVLRYIMS